VNLTPGQLERIGQLSDQWSFLWDKRRAVWIAAEDCPDGEQVEEADLDILLARLPVIPGQPPRQLTRHSGRARRVRRRRSRSG
jgi:hypothetical protein